MANRWEPWRAFTQSLDFTSFAPGSRVLDIGCGTGWLLKELTDAGCRPTGIDPDAGLIAGLREQGYDAHHGVAEKLPFESATFDGIVCRVVVPYTDEARAIGEWGRVLRHGGQVRASYHGAGYYAHYALRGDSLAERAYGVRSILGTWFYAISKRRLPGWLGDTLYQARRRLARHYLAAGLHLTEERIGAPFLGRPVFIYHTLERV